MENSKEIIKATLKELIWLNQQRRPTLEHLKDGYFTATGKIFGIPTVYVLKGDMTDLESTIVGRIELGPFVRPRALVYKGTTLKGGEFLGSASEGLRKSLENFTLDGGIKDTLNGLIDD